MKNLTIGMIGAGEMGASLAAAFVAADHRVLADLSDRSNETRHRASKVGIETVASLSDLVSGVDILFSILPTQCALFEAHLVAKAMSETGCTPTFVEANAIAPALTREIAALFQGTKAPYIDGGIIGPPPSGGERPRLYAVGCDLAILHLLDGTGFDLVEMNGAIGQASAFKMTYAAMTKGTNALLTNVMLSAQAYGFLDEFLSEVADSQQALSTRAHATIPRLPCDAARWEDEMKQIARSFGDLGLPPEFHLGAGVVMQLLAQSTFGQETRRNRDLSRNLNDTIVGVWSGKPKQ